MQPSTLLWDEEQESSTPADDASVIHAHGRHAVCSVVHRLDALGIARAADEAKEKAIPRVPQLHGRVVAPGRKYASLVV